MSSELETDVTNQLRRSDDFWTRTPEYGKPKRETVLVGMQAIYDTIRNLTGNQYHANLDEDFDTTNQFVTTAFDIFEERIPAPRHDWAFMVPARTARQQGPEYASEITPFLPLLDPKYGVSSDVRLRSIVHLAPSMIDQYVGSDDKKGALVFTPLFEDMRKDLPSSGDVVRTAATTIDTAAFFVRNQLGARVVGLGAHIPAMTKLGNTVREEGLTVTTGHAGTVHLIGETTKLAIEKLHNERPTIGVIGAAGSIGQASVNYLLDHSVSDLPINVYDKRSTTLKDRKSQADWNIRTAFKNDELEILENSDVIVAAVTTPIDLDILDPEKQLDLYGKIIIDDSQPGSFERAQVEQRGGKLLWVVGQDQSDTHFLKRINDYSYGDTAGIYGKNSVFGCEAEVASIAVTGEYDAAMRGPVSTQKAHQIGELFKRVGVTVGQPQSFGRPVDI